MNLARVETILVLILIGAFGFSRWRSIVNPVTLVVAPMAAALALEEAVLGASAPFSLLAGLYVSGAVLAFTFGTALRPVPQGAPKTLAIKPIGSGQGFALSVAFLVLGLLLYLGGNVVRNVFNGVAATINNPVFDRGLVDAHLAGANSLIVRGVTAFGILFAVPVGLWWVSAARWRLSIIALYIVGLVNLGAALRARLPTLLGAGLLVLVIYLGRSRDSKQRSRVRGLKTIVAGVMLAGGAYVISNVIYAARIGNTENATQFAYSVAGGPSAMSEVVTGAQPLTIYGGGGVSIEGLLGLVNRHQTLGNFSSVTLGVESGHPEQINIYSGIGVLDFDFGYVPTLAVFFVLGVVVASTWLRVSARPTAGSITTLAGLALLCVSIPECILSQYNFWWFLIVAAPSGANLLFRVAGDSTPSARVLIARSPA